MAEIFARERDEQGTARKARRGSFQLIPAAMRGITARSNATN